MSQTRLSNVSTTKPEKLSRRLLKSPSTMTSKQPAVFLTRYVWSRNRPVSSLRESPSLSSKLPTSEKKRVGNTAETKPQQRSSSVSMRPPGSPMWPPRSLRWSKHWEASLASNTQVKVTAKCEPTAYTDMWLPAAQMSTLPQKQMVLSATQVTGMSPTEMTPTGSTETSMTLSTASHRLSVMPDALLDTCAKPSAFESTPKNLLGNPRVRNASSRASRKSSVALGQSQQLMKWPPRSVKWPNRWNKFSSIPRFSSESSVRPRALSEAKSGTLPLVPKEVMSTQISRTSPRVQRNSTQSQVMERFPVKTTSISKDIESSLGSSADSSPLSERSSRWSDSLETSGMSPVGSTESSASQRSPTGPTMSLPVLTDHLTLGMMRCKESVKLERKSSTKKSVGRSTTSSGSSSWTPGKCSDALKRPTGQIVKSRKLQGQSQSRPIVSSSVRRIQRKLSEFSRPPADDTSSSLESMRKFVPPTSPVCSSTILKPEVKLVRSASWPTQFPKSTSLLPEHSMTKESESALPSRSRRTLSKPLRASSSVSAMSSMKEPLARWERKILTDVPLFSSMLEPCVPEHQFIQSSGSSATLENSPMFPNPSEMVDRPPRKSSQCASALGTPRISVSSPALQKYSPELSSSLTKPMSLNCTSPSIVPSKSVSMKRASVSVSQVSTKDLKGSIENPARLLEWPTKSSTTSTAPVVIASSAALGASWGFHKPSVTSKRSQAWLQTQSMKVGSLPTSAASSETCRRSQATSSAGAAILGTVPDHSAASAEFPLSSTELSKSFQNQGTPVNILPRYSPGHLISSVTQLSLSPVESRVSPETEKSAPRMLKKSSPVPLSSPFVMLPLSESSSERSLKRRTRAMMPPTLATKFLSRSAVYESSSDLPLACRSVSPSWPSVPPSRPEIPPMMSLGQSDRHRMDATSCQAEHNTCASPLAGCYAQTGSHTQSRNSVFAASTTLLQSPKISQLVPAEPGAMQQKSLICPRSSMGLTQSSTSFQPSSFQTSTTNIIVNTTASFPLEHSFSPSVSHHVTHAQAPMNPTSSSRYTQFPSSANVIAQSVPSTSLSTKMMNRSEAVPGASLASGQLVTPTMWTPFLEMPSSSLQRKALPLRSERDVVSWTSNTCSKQPVTSADTHSQLGSQALISTSDAFTVSSVTSACSSARLTAPSWSMASTVFPSITSAGTEPKLPVFSWISSGPLWMPVQSANSSCTSTTTHLMTSAPAQAVTRSLQTWASSAAQLSTVVPSSKGPVVCSMVHTPSPQPEPSISWSRSRPAAWSSTSTASTGVLGVQRGSSSGLVRLPIKYIKRLPLPRTCDIESTSSSTS